MSSGELKEYTTWEKAMETARLEFPYAPDLAKLLAKRIVTVATVGDNVIKKARQGGAKWLKTRAEAKSASEKHLKRLRRMVAKMRPPPMRRTPEEREQIKIARLKRAALKVRREKRRQKLRDLGITPSKSMGSRAPLRRRAPRDPLKPRIERSPKEQARISQMKREAAQVRWDRHRKELRAMGITPKPRGHRSKLNWTTPPYPRRQRGSDGTYGIKGEPSSGSGGVTYAAPSRVSRRGMLRPRASKGSAKKEIDTGAVQPKGRGRGRGKGRGKGHPKIAITGRYSSSSSSAPPPGTARYRTASGRLSRAKDQLGLPNPTNLGRQKMKLQDAAGSRAWPASSEAEAKRRRTLKISMSDEAQQYSRIKKEEWPPEQHASVRLRATSVRLRTKSTEQVMPASIRAKLLGINKQPGARQRDSKLKPLNLKLKPLSSRYRSSGSRYPCGRLRPCSTRSAADEGSGRPGASSSSSSAPRQCTNWVKSESRKEEACMERERRHKTPKLKGITEMRDFYLTRLRPRSGTREPPACWLEEPEDATPPKRRPRRPPGRRTRAESWAIATGYRPTDEVPVAVGIQNSAHDLWAVGGYIFCNNCGAYATGKRYAVTLSFPCPGFEGRGQGAVARWRRLKEGRHPTGAHPLGASAARRVAISTGLTN